MHLAELLDVKEENGQTHEQPQQHCGREGKCPWSRECNEGGLNKEQEAPLHTLV